SRRVPASSSAGEGAHHGATAPLPQTAPARPNRSRAAPGGGRWLAYESDSSGQFEIYVKPFPDVDAGQWRLSTAGGTRPLWAPNGQALFYVAPRRSERALSPAQHVVHRVDQDAPGPLREVDLHRHLRRRRSGDGDGAQARHLVVAEVDVDGYPCMEPRRHCRLCDGAGDSVLAAAQIGRLERGRQRGNIGAVDPLVEEIV